MRILVFGDSITQGYFDEACGGWANRLHMHTIQKRIETDHEYDGTVFSMGISGDCTNRLLERFDVEAKARAREEGNVFVFAIGVNDTQRYVDSGEIKTPHDVFEKNIETLIQKAKAYTNHIVLIGIAPVVVEMLQPMPWASDRAHYTEDLDQYDAVLQDACEKSGCVYVDMKGVFGTEPEKLLPDGIHPNTEGHRLMYERIKTSLEENDIL